MKNIDKLPFKVLIESIMNFEKQDTVSYIIGTDTRDKYVSAYTLARRTGNNLEVLLSKEMNDKKAFEQEVNNLATYFNAVVFE